MSLLIVGYKLTSPTDRLVGGWLGVENYLIFVISGLAEFWTVFSLSLSITGDSTIPRRNNKSVSRISDSPFAFILKTSTFLRIWPTEDFISIDLMTIYGP